MEKGSERFDAIEQCLEERATVLQLSELSAKLDALVSRVEDLEDENTALKKQVCRCEQGSQDHPIEVEDGSESKLSYATPEEVAICLLVPISVLPAVSGQRCKPSRNHLISRIAYPSISSGHSPSRTATVIRKKRMEFALVVSGLQSSQERFRRLRDWRRAAESAVDPGYFSDDSASTDWDSLGRSSCSFTTSSSDSGSAGGSGYHTDRSIGFAAEQGGNRRGIGFEGSFGGEGDCGEFQGGLTSCHDES
jgi:hypothetical protein